VHAAEDFDVASDMLTRTSETNDFAADVSVFPCAPDPETGGRQLEQLAFEVVSTESLGHAAAKAAKLVARGVRRVFAIDVRRARALEWSTSPASWSLLDPGTHIEDPALAAPLPVNALLHAAKADDAVARALIVKRNPEIATHTLQARTEGKQEGIAESLLAFLSARGVALAVADRARILGERDPAMLNRWVVRAATCDTAASLFEDS
jgi:hypothetical protein